MKFFVFILLFVPVATFAQTLTQKLEQTKVGEGSVIIYQASYIKALLDGRQVAPSVTETQAPHSLVAKSTSKKPSSSSKMGTVARSSKSSVKTQGEPTHKTPEEKTIRSAEETSASGYSYAKKVYTNSKTIEGYRIQLYSGGNDRNARKKAYSVGYMFKSMYMEVPVYTHFTTPHWMCCVGNFKTYQEAKHFLTELKKTPEFSGANIIKTKIQVEQ